MGRKCTQPLNRMGSTSHTLDYSVMRINAFQIISTMWRNPLKAISVMPGKAVFILAVFIL